ncbi:unnamed protein product [Rotaria magnacalcarata]|uniref:Serine/threonine-protein phosphatase n=1 Tax=Rotaria magnacalcarata TaxID=392030 RepID=A0A8S2PBV5_9BILA|nr:unnamed protein product [Rotaria magnacalcarata]CAF4039442.1 unnamed protein product [Rotaria magnacalcarata]CAF4079689.1 unnamed protein product [Rotaria magnacalcarata]
MNENSSNTGGDIDRWLEWIKDCKYLPETDFKQLCTIISDIFFEESNVQPIFSPVTICGDLHGQYYDVQELYRTGGYPPDTQYIFMGDFVDRGYYSLETLTQLLVFKAKWPDRITLLRGNHESRQVTQVYGFYDECMKKYGNANLWRYCCRLFDLMPIGALIDNEVLCIHGIKFMFDEHLVTVWSAPNYCYRCGNIAAILAFHTATNHETKLFNAVPDNERVIPSKTTTPYFL